MYSRILIKCVSLKRIGFPMQRTAGYSHNAMAVISYKVRFNISEGVLKLIASSAAINFFLREEVEASTSETRETAS